MKKNTSSCDVDPGVRDFKLRHEGPRDDLYAAMPPLEAKEVLSTYTSNAEPAETEDSVR